jgi:hypothetical protein
MLVYVLIAQFWSFNSCLVPPDVSPVSFEMRLARLRVLLSPQGHVGRGGGERRRRRGLELVRVMLLIHGADRRGRGVRLAREAAQGVKFD